jgi:hypothetical protein
MKNTQSNLKIYEVGSWEVDCRWPEIWPRLEEALNKSISRDDPEAVKDALKASTAKAVVFNSGDFVLIIEVVPQSAGKVLRVPYAAGNLTPILQPVLGYIEDAAKNNGCFGVEIPGRKGFEKLLQEFGYVFSYQVLSKEV